MNGRHEHRKALVDEYEAICEILEREVTESGVNRFITDPAWREQQRERINEVEPVD